MLPFYGTVWGAKSKVTLPGLGIFGSMPSMYKGDTYPTDLVYICQELLENEKCNALLRVDNRILEA